MATTYTQGYKIKLIGTGLEAGTWGTSTNENWERLEQVLYGVFDITITSPVAPDTYNNDEYKWTLQDTADAGEASGKQRAAFVTFSGNVSAEQTLVICGATVSEFAQNRVFCVRNNLDNGHKLKISTHASNSNSFTLQNGAAALIYSSDVSSGTVASILDVIQLSGINMEGGAGEVLLKDELAVALDIKEGTNSYLKFNTTDGSEEVEVVQSLKVSGVLDVDNAEINTETQATTIKIKNNDAASLSIQDAEGATLEFLKFDTQSTEALTVGSGTDKVDNLNIKTSSVSVADQTTSISLKDDEAAALDIKEASNSYLKFVTTNDSESVTLGKTLITDVEFVAKGTSDLQGDVDFGANIDITAAAPVVKLPVDTAAALSIQDTADADTVFLNFDTTGTEALTVGSGTDKVDTLNIKTSSVSVADQTTSISLKDDEPAALDIKEASDSYLKFVTTVGEESVTLGKTLKPEPGAVSNGNGIETITNTEWRLSNNASALHFTSLGGSDDIGDKEDLVSISGLNTAPRVLIHNPSNGAPPWDVANMALQLQPGVEFKNFGTSLFSDDVSITGTTEVSLTSGTMIDIAGEFQIGGVEVSSDAAELNLLNGNTKLLPDADDVYFETSDQAVSDGSSGSEEHGFSEIPRVVQGALVCKTAEGNYSVNDEVSVNSWISDAGEGISCGADSSDVFYAVGSSGFRLPNKTTGVAFEATPASWKLVIRSWA